MKKYPYKTEDAVSIQNFSIKYHHIAYLTSNKAIVGNLTTMFGRYISSDRAPQDSNSWEITETHKKLNLTIIILQKLEKLLPEVFTTVALRKELKNSSELATITVWLVI